MGKPSDQTLVSHFSHPHPLTLTNLPQSNPTPPCAACKAPSTAAAAIYACLPCNFILHHKCFHLSPKIVHPVDPTHPLTLHAKPVYPEGLFRCDACGNSSDGFSYHCSPCGIDLHTVCALLPMDQFSHPCHVHPLALAFSSPYPGNKFSCDVCKVLGSNTWIYRCGHCDFDVHLTCVVPEIPRAAVNPPSLLQPFGVVVNPQVGGGYGGSGAGLVAPPAGAVLGQPQGRIGGGGLGDQMAIAVVNGIAGGIAESATQFVLQEVMGSGSANMDGGACNSGGGYEGTEGGYY